MNKLELRYLACYLPYKLEVHFEGEDLPHELIGLDITERGAQLLSPYNDYGTCSLDRFKPILRPLSAYKNLFGKALIDLNCDLETQIQITEFANQDRSLNSISYDAYNELVKAKVDVFGLIEKGLAADATKVEGGGVPNGHNLHRRQGSNSLCLTGRI